ncbi:uncharacterized protein RJT20DRAFT_48916 [Scheffersomyces xylosifermentans]|uniref:uncharacterized protein n=1 Tax=Scheffersomyces xylosifermentans TaxID=1304137 RepID=UPI00315C8EE3
MSSSNAADDAVLANLLADLNPNQRLAVTSPANGRLQIIAGPGTGKTKVLTSRVAYLMLKEKIPAHHIIVTTFTKKAANELTERLETLLKDTAIDVSKILAGTFHSICYRVLMIYGKKLGIENYNIADDRDSDHILKEVLSNLGGSDVDFLAGLPDEDTIQFKANQGTEKKYYGYDTKKIKRQISKLKSSGIKYDTYENMAIHNKCLSFFYKRYQTKLQQSCLLDFDDCLLYCNVLVSTYPVMNFVEHVLVDEFQDTNEIQLQLMYQFARGHPTNKQMQDNVTIVGDPDQSIYAFRDAQAINFEKMSEHYARRYPTPCNIVSLTDNYRSTTDILVFSETVMRQQQKRILKSLKSQIDTTFKPVYYNLTSPEEEAKWICYQIEHLMALPNSPFRFTDMSVLVRAAYQTRAIENEFVRRRIPYFMIRGKAFWDRKEVVAILDYMRIIAHDNDRVAFLRTINYPKRGLGEKTIASIEALLERETISGRESVYKTLQQIVDNEFKEVKLTSKTRQTLTSFLKMISEARVKLNELNIYLKNDSIDQDRKASDVADLFKFIYSRSGLEHEFANDPNQDLNVKEVEKQLCEYKYKEEELPLFHGGQESDVAEDSRNYLARFIHSVGFYETEEEDRSHSEENGNKKYRGKVALSTIHGSKGLEWPVVFVPGLSEGLLPARFAVNNGGPEAVDEERRCFYVATTRAKTLLYMSSYTSLGSGGWNVIENVSRFLERIRGTEHITDFQDAFKSWDSLRKLYEVVNKEVPTKESFPLQHFNKLYEGRLTPFIKGESFSINEESFRKSVNDNVMSGIGFTSAAMELNKKRRPIGLGANIKKQLKPSMAPQMKPFRPLITTPVGQRAPPYRPPSLKSNRAPVSITPAISSSNTNRAPAYIPDRKSSSQRRPNLGNRAPSTHQK